MQGALGFGVSGRPRRPSVVYYQGLRMSCQGTATGAAFSGRSLGDRVLDATSSCYSAALSRTGLTDLDSAVATNSLTRAA